MAEDSTGKKAMQADTLSTPAQSDRPAGPSSPLKIAIVGGGIAGVALGVGLAGRSHLDATLYEAARAFGEVGAGVSFGPNAVRAVAGLGLEREYLALADRTPAPWQDIWFDWRYAQDEGHIGSSIAAPTGQSSVHRAEFLELLSQRLPEGMARFSKRAVSVAEDERGARILFADGSQATADLVIVADGIKSALRHGVLQGRGASPADPIYSGTRAYRGMIDTAALRQSFSTSGLDTRMVDVPQMFLGQDTHVLTFPVRQGTLTNIVAFTTHPQSPAWPEGEPWVRAATSEEMLADFATCGPAVRTLLSRIEQPTVWALHDLPELDAYVHGRVALIGDAAHAMLPHQGAGAGQGLEDAYFLAQLLADASLQPKEIPRLLQIYEAIRKPRACVVQRTSREAGDLYEFRSEEAGADRAALKHLLETRFNWIWNHDLDGDVQQARTLMAAATVTG